MKNPEYKDVVIGQSEELVAPQGIAAPHFKGSPKITVTDANGGVYLADGVMNFPIPTKIEKHDGLWQSEEGWIIGENGPVFIPRTDLVTKDGISVNHTNTDEMRTPLQLVKRGEKSEWWIRQCMSCAPRPSAIALANKYNLNENITTGTCECCMDKMINNPEVYSSLITLTRKLNKMYILLLDSIK